MDSGIIEHLIRSYIKAEYLDRSSGKDRNIPPTPFTVEHFVGAFMALGAGLGLGLGALAVEIVSKRGSMTLPLVWYQSNEVDLQEVRRRDLPV